MYRAQRAKLNDCPEAPNDQHPHTQMQQGTPPLRNARYLSPIATGRPAPDNLGHYGDQVEQTKNQKSHKSDDAHNCHSTISIGNTLDISPMSKSTTEINGRGLQVDLILDLLAILVSIILNDCNVRSPF
jgi:hypothetical protein